MKARLIIALSALFLPLMGIRAQENLELIVGTYTDGASKGIYSFDFNQHSGTVKALHSLNIENPSYLTLSKDGNHIYAVSEKNDTTATVSTVKFDKHTGAMQLINTQRTYGEDPCYIATNGKIVLTANYSGGSMSIFPLNAEGILQPMSRQIKGGIGGPDADRQAIPHIHCTRFAPDGKHIYATDFSADRLLQIEIKKDKSTLGKAKILVKVPRDSGPRHIEYSSDGRFLYIMSELSGNVTVFDLQNKNKKMLQEIQSDEVNARGGADIHISPDGRFLYSSNRLKNDGIAIFKVNTETGMLTKVGYQLTGMHPRNFNITPNGKFLLCACRDSNIIQVFEINRSTGLLTDTHHDIHVDKPVCIAFCSGH